MLLLEGLGQIAGVGGIALGAVFLIFRQVLTMAISRLPCYCDAVTD
jgi:hypothetical protein